MTTLQCQHVIIKRWVSTWKITYRRCERTVSPRTARIYCWQHQPLHQQGQT